MDEINQLMNTDPNDLSAQDLDKIIAEKRRLYASYTSGAKPTKGTVEAPKLATILPSIAPPKITNRRKV